MFAKYPKTRTITYQGQEYVVKLSRGGCVTVYVEKEDCRRFSGMNDSFNPIEPSRWGMWNQDWIIDAVRFWNTGLADEIEHFACGGASGLKRVDVVDSDGCNVIGQDIAMMSYELEQCSDLVAALDVDRLVDTTMCSSLRAKVLSAAMELDAADETWP